MTLFTLSLGFLGTNCYILPTDQKNAVVIDPASSQEVLDLCEKEGLKITTIILTHGHYDHFSGVSEIVDKTGAKVYSNLPDEHMFSSYNHSWAEYMPMVDFVAIFPDETFSDGQSFKIDNLEFKAMGTPGHTKGSCFLFCEDSIFAGDTLFRGSVGRTDGFSGSFSDQQATLLKIAKIESDYTIYCGHGDPTTLSREKKYNSYLVMAMRDSNLT